MSAPINKKLPELTLDELTTVLKKATYRGYNVNKLAETIEKNGVDKLAYNAFTNQFGVLNADGKLKNKIKLSKIHSAEGDVKLSWSLTRFFKMHVFSCCFNHEAYDKRIETLAKELHTKIQESEAKEKAEANILNSKDFALMKTILKSQSKEIELDLFDKGSDVPKATLCVQFNKITEFNKTESIEIWSLGNRNKSLVFQLGAVLTCLVDNQPTDLDKIPANKSDWLMGSFKAAIELSSKYALKNKKIEISVLKRGVEQNPSDHLSKLSDALREAVKTEDHPLLEVVLLKDDLTIGKGLDNGGISRDYLNSLFTSLTENSHVNFKSQKPSKLFMPVATQKGVSSDNPATLFPGLTDMEKRSLNEVGRVMMFCYNSLPNTVDFKNYSYGIGQHFDELLFEIALTLQADEVNTNFEDLSVNVKANMAKIIFEKFLRADKTNEDAAIKDKLELFKLFNWKQGNLLTNMNLNAAAEFARDFIDEDDGFSLDINAVIVDPQKFVNTVRENLLNEKLGTTTVSELIAPIHAIAQGLRSAQSSDFEWMRLMRVKARDLNDKIQGSLDRKVIAEAFEVKTQVLKDQHMVNKSHQEIKELNKKTKWLKDWIESKETKDEAIRKFLVYATGSNSLPKDQKIFIDEQSPQLDAKKNIIRNVDGTVFYNPTPVANTCSHTILMSPVGCGQSDGINDKSEAAFKKMLYETILSVQSFEINQD